MEEALENSRYVALVLTPDALASDWVALERSAAIHRDPRSRRRSLIPLLRRDCEMPELLARLKYIDVRRDQDFAAGLETLVAILRGLPNPRSTGLEPAEIHFGEDAALLHQHRRAFDRPAFRVSCILELSVPELSEAIDDTAAAINTGSLYSRAGRLLSTFPDQNEYHLPDFRNAFSRIAENLTDLKRKVVECREFFLGDAPDYSRQIAVTFSRMVTLSARVDPHSVRALVAFLDGIDELRNRILDELNSLLAKSGEPTFPLIELSSRILKKGERGPRGLAPLLD